MYSASEQNVLGYMPMLRRGLMAILVLNLAVLVPLPLSACAIAAGLDGPCQCTMPMHGNAMPQVRSSSSGPAISCRCVEAEAPFPDAVQNVRNHAPTVSISRLVSVAMPKPVISRAELSGTPATSHLGPPGGRAGLCIFLI